MENNFTKVKYFLSIIVQGTKTSFSLCTGVMIWKKFPKYTCYERVNALQDSLTSSPFSRVWSRFWQLLRTLLCSIHPNISNVTFISWFGLVKGIQKCSTSWSFSFARETLIFFEWPWENQFFSLMECPNYIIEDSILYNTSRYFQRSIKLSIWSRLRPPKVVWKMALCFCELRCALALRARQSAQKSFKTLPNIIFSLASLILLTSKPRHK